MEIIETNYKKHIQAIVDCDETDSLTGTMVMGENLKKLKHLHMTSNNKYGTLSI